MYRSSATIDDIFRLALPQGTVLLTGAEYMSRPVSWACSLRPSPPAFPKLDGNELALVDMDDLARLDPQLRLERVVRSLRSARISAIAVTGEISQLAIDTAVEQELPVFQLPKGTQLMQIERTVIRLIVDRDSYIAQRSADLQRELNQIALDGGGLDRLAEQLYHFGQAPVVLLRDEGKVAATAGMDSLTKSSRQAVLNSIPNITSLRSWAAQQSATKLAGSVGALTLEPKGDPVGFRRAVVSPIFANEAVRGFCMVLRRSNGVDVSAVEEITVVQGAAAAALEWAKQNAVDVAEERMRATFVDELLAAEIADEQAWIQRGASLDYDLTRPHAAWMVEATKIPDWPSPLLTFVAEQGVNAPFSRRDEGLLLFWPIDNPKSARELKNTANEFVNYVTGRYPGAELIMGLARPAVSPAMWLQSQQQARESWRMGKAWKGSPVTYFGDLGLYQLLTALGDNAEARRFFRKTLGLLITHDRDHKGELVETLEGFFECHGNLSQTANRLHIHRNTLSYRLERIAAITRLDLNDPDARFSLQLALKLRPIMQ
jgi:purine catabolism regulator